MTEFLKINDRHQATDQESEISPNTHIPSAKIKDREKSWKETGGKIFLPMEEQGYKNYTGLLQKSWKQEECVVK